MLRFRLVQENLYASIKIGTHEDVASAAFSALLNDGINGNINVGTVYAFRLFFVLPLFPCLDLLDDAIRIRCKYGACHYSIMSLYTLPEIIAIPTNARKLGIIVMGLPDINALIFGTANYVLSIRAKARFNLTTDINVSLVLAR